MAATRTFARWTLELSAADMPPEVRYAVSRHLLDGIGCGLAAARLGEAGAVLAVARTLGGPEEATLLDGSRAAAPPAALANGALVHALDFDDTHADALVHVTAAVLPAALAAAEQARASGEELLTACVAGFELVIRLGSAVRHGFHARGFHATSVCGVFAAALAAARLQGLGEDRTVDALGIAGSLAGGSLEFLHDGSSTKQLHPGTSAQSGLLATALAAAGASGPETILEGEYGLFAAYADRRVDARQLTQGLGDEWRSTGITIKPYPACQLSHASLDALLAAGVDAGDVEALTFRVPAEAVPIVCEPLGDKSAPRTPYEAKFSLPWCAAALLLDGSLGVESFAPANIDRPEIAELARRVAYEAYEPGTAAANAGGEATVHKRDGTIVTGTVEASRGGPAAPLADDALLEKFRLNAPGHEQLAKRILALDAIDDVRELTALFAAPVGIAR